MPNSTAVNDRDATTSGLTTRETGTTQRATARQPTARQLHRIHRQSASGHPTASSAPTGDQAACSAIPITITLVIRFRIRNPTVGSMIFP